MNDIIRIAQISLRGMWKFRWLGLGVAWAAGLLMILVITLLPNRYEATARIYVNTDSILRPLMQGLTVQPNETQRIVMLSRVVISRPNVERLIKVTGLDHDVKNQFERDALMEKVMRTLEFKPAGRDSPSLFVLTFRDSDPQRAKKAVEFLAQTFIESSQGGKSEDTQTAKKFIDEQIVAYDRKLQEAETRLKDFRLRYLGIGGGSGGEGRTDHYSRMADSERQLNQARLELREAERSRDIYRRQIESENAAAAAGTGTAPPAAVSAAVAEIDARLDAQRRSMDNLLQRFTESHPDVVGARRVIADLEQQKRNVIANAPRGGVPLPPVSTSLAMRASEQLKISLAQSEATVAALSARVAEFSARNAQLKLEAAKVPQLEAELAQLNRDYEVHKRNYETLVSRRESANLSGQMSAVAGVDDIRLVDPPRVPLRPSFPNRPLLIPLAMLAALLAGAVAAYLAHQIRPTFFDGRSLREATGLPLLGVVSLVQGEPQMREKRRHAVRFAGGFAAVLASYVAGAFALNFLIHRMAS